MPRYHTFYGEWCKLLEEHLERRACTQTAIAAKAGVSVVMFNTYLAGRSKPTTEKVKSIAEALGLKGKELKEFEWAAYQFTMPSEIWELLWRWEAELAELRKECHDLRAALSTANAENGELRNEMVELARKVGAAR